MSDVVINATVACTLHAYYRVHILHSTLLPLSRVLTRLGTIATTATCTYRSAYPHGSPVSRALSRLGVAANAATPVLMLEVSESDDYITSTQCNRQSTRVHATRTATPCDT